MPKPDVHVEVTGLKELNKAFKKVDADLSKELKTGFKAIAESIAVKVRSKVPRLSGKAASSYKARGTQKGGGIAFGGTKAPYTPWLDFGGKVGRNKSIERPFITQGRYLYPTITENKAEIIDQTDKLVEKVVKHSGFETKGDN